MHEYIPFRNTHDLARDFARPGITLVHGADAALLVSGVCNGRYPAPATLCFVDRPPDDTQRQLLGAAVVLTTPALAEGLSCKAIALADDPRAAFIDLVAGWQHESLLAPLTSLGPMRGAIDPTARVHARAVIEADVCIGPGCEVAAGCVLKRGTVLMQDVVVRENTVIGCEGIARYVAADGRVLRFPHLAGVLVQRDTEIGAGCVIARGALTSTRIGAGSIIGNLCNIGHGVQVGAKTWMSVGCMIGGNSRLEDNVTLGLGVNIRDNLLVGEGASVAMGSTVMRSIAAGVSVLGNPAKVVPGIVAGPSR